MEVDYHIVSQSVRLSVNSYLPINTNPETAGTEYLRWWTCWPSTPEGCLHHGENLAEENIYMRF